MNVIKKLRRKFILLSTATVTIIVVMALSLVTIIAYMRINAQIESFLLYISQNGGHITAHRLPPTNNWFDETDWTGDTPDFSYQIRYLSIIIDDNGLVKAIDIQNIAAFTEQEAIEYANKALKSQTFSGFFKKDRASYAYKITNTSNGDHLIVIMDCTRDMAFVQDFIRDSIELGIACILLYIFILAILSKQAIKPFVRNMENQKRFITNAGHELKTPLAIISANTEAIELINGKSQWTEGILKQIRRLSNLINDLVMLSKMSEQSTAKIILTNTNISEITTDISKSFLQMATDQEKTLIYQIKPQVFIKSENKCLYELINILVDNAVKYCDNNGTINIKLTSNKKQAYLTISNDYIDGQNLDFSRFFERFYREDSSHNSEKMGYGIGLSIAEELTKLLKGNIKVHYNNNKIIFTIKFNLIK